MQGSASPNVLPEGVELERTLEVVERQLYADLYRAVPRELAREFGISASREAGALRLTATGVDHPFFNRVMGVGLERAPDRHWSKTQADHFRSSGIRRFMLQILPHIETEALRQDLTHLGLQRLRGWAKHVGPARGVSGVRSDLDVERIHRDRAETWARLCGEGFHLPAALQPWLAETVGRADWYHYLAFAGDRPAACAALVVNGRFATLCFAATAPEHRRRGAQSALIARRMADAAGLECRWVVSETDEELPDRPNPSYRNVIRLGLPVRYVRANWGPPKPE